jgi:hypothetical protein
MRVGTTLLLGAVFALYGLFGVPLQANIGPAVAMTAAQTSLPTDGPCIFGHNDDLGHGCKGGSLWLFGKHKQDDSSPPSGPLCPQVLNSDGSVTCAPGPVCPQVLHSNGSVTCAPSPADPSGNIPHLGCASAFTDECRVCDNINGCETVPSPFTHPVIEDQPHVEGDEPEVRGGNNEPAEVP